MVMTRRGRRAHARAGAIAIFEARRRAVTGAHYLSRRSTVSTERLSAEVGLAPIRRARIRYLAHYSTQA